MLAGFQGWVQGKSRRFWEVQQCWFWFPSICSSSVYFPFGILQLVSSLEGNPSEPSLLQEVPYAWAQSGSFPFGGNLFLIGRLLAGKKKKEVCMFSCEIRKSVQMISKIPSCSKVWWFYGFVSFLGKMKTTDYKLSREHGHLPHVVELFIIFFVLLISLSLFLLYSWKY